MIAAQSPEREAVVQRRCPSCRTPVLDTLWYVDVAGRTAAHVVRRLTTDYSGERHVCGPPAA